MKHFIGGALIVLGLVVASGAEAPNLSNLEVTMQGLCGIVLMFIGVKLS